MSILQIMRDEICIIIFLLYMHLCIFNLILFFIICVLLSVYWKLVTLNKALSDF